MRSFWRTLRRRRTETPDKRIRDLVESVVLPTPFTIDRLVDVVAAHTGRRIVLHPLYDLPPEISGVSLPVTDDEKESSFVVCYDATVPEWSQQLIILHELGHHLLGHPHRPLESATPEAECAGQFVAVGAQGGRGLCRTSFDDPREIEAEWFATFMTNRVERLRRAEISPTLQGIRRGIEPRSRWTDQ
ncbi:hypothetical protein [Actinoplanes regularis]|uniref:hypothetical protein n=1 Tax=Actinoplanes regularis TaxID=52697 RepID=UPI0024A50768|nr:hypothetical protein [Actinoplanes regularis]GLW31139.1 hypothetical protein Areg01_40790 [Actinoplanes regularis]